MTPLDQAHDAMEKSPENHGARLRFYERLADSELFVMLEREPSGQKIEPKIFPLEEARYLLVFDRIERLAEFSDQQAPYAALSGRKLVEMIKGQGLGFGVNLGVAPSSILVPATAIDWLAEALANDTAEVEAQVLDLIPPFDLPDDFLQALDRKLAAMAGAASQAYLAGTVFDDGTRGLLLGFVAAHPDAEPALRQAVTEAVSFSAQHLSLDIAFLEAGTAMAGKLAVVGLGFDIPKPQSPAKPTPVPPGLDPAKPPKLR